MPTLTIDGRRFAVSDFAGNGPLWTVQIDEEKVEIEILQENQETMMVRVGGRVIRIAIERDQHIDGHRVELNGRPMFARIEDEAVVPGQGSIAIEAGPLLVTSPMAGKIASVKVEVGAAVEEGQALVFLEAMKMENEIAAPKKGIVKEIYVRQGSLAKPGDKLVLVE